MAYEAKGRKKNFPVFDCDSHIYEPAEVWDKYIPAGQREFAKAHFYRDPDRLLWFAMGRFLLETQPETSMPLSAGILG